jgi:hypothetical protein
VGVLLLLRNTSVIDDRFWPELAVYLPVLLIAIGVEKIFTKSKLQFISYLTTVAFSVGGIALALDYGYRYTDDFPYSTSVFIQEKDADVKRLRAVMDVDETDLEVRRSGEDLVYARFEDFIRRPRTSFGVDNGVGNLRMIAQGSEYCGGLVTIDTDTLQKWDVRFSDSVPLELICSGRGSEFHLDLSETPVTRLELDAEETAIFVHLGRLLPKVDVEIISEDSELELVVPATSGIKVTGEENRTWLLKAGLIGVNDGYVCDGYDTAQFKIDIDIDGNLKSLRISYEDTI